MKFQAGEIKSSSSLTIRSIVRHLVFVCCSHPGTGLSAAPFCHHYHFKKQHENPVPGLLQPTTARSSSFISQRIVHRQGWLTIEPNARPSGPIALLVLAQLLLFSFHTVLFTTLSHMFPILHNSRLRCPLF
ncbi:hypothetical protein K457DRAFT_862073 [Linnemannia elongata AG-77]|uniref:Uncharacterized protein n=1 Tax=Linnemannia elongata AG-77 TaxID=1314771 RepID=A0A197KAF9_9FUNG|nr:hypothetical protein K457DRAFT_862073 [Linnemannia elongata AG-77]